MDYPPTKRPWNCDDSRRELTIGWAPTAHIKDEDGFPIANVRSPEDAELIVLAVNCHDELVEALKVSIFIINDYQKVLNNITLPLDKLEQVLEKSEKSCGL